jgi:hypothetical protein
MTDNKMTKAQCWTGLYRTGAWAAMIFVVMVFIPLFLIFSAPLPPAGDGAALLDYIRAHPAIYIVQLVCFVGLSLPALLVFAALGPALFRADRTKAALGALVGIASEIVALSVLSSPQSLHAGLLVLAADWAKADALQRPALAAAAQALAATANSVTPAGIMTALAIMILSLAMRRIPASRWFAIFGAAGGLAGVALEALRPIAGPLYMLYGLFLPAWFLVVGIRLFRLARSSADGWEILG